MLVTTRWTPTYEATVPVLLQPTPLYVDAAAVEEPREITVDTEASMVFSMRRCPRCAASWTCPTTRSCVRTSA